MTWKRRILVASLSLAGLLIAWLVKAGYLTLVVMYPLIRTPHL